MRTTLLASAISTSVAMAFPVALLSSTSDAVRIHGCHQTYGEDAIGCGIDMIVHVKSFGRL